MEHERKAKEVMNSRMNKIMYFFDKTFVSSQIIDHYTDALEVYEKEGNKDKIIEMKKRLIALYDNAGQFNNIALVITYNREIGDAYLELNNLKQAEEYYKRTIQLCHSSGELKDVNKSTKIHYEDLMYCYEKIAIKYFSVDQFSLAYDYYKKYIEGTTEGVSNNTYINMVICNIKLGKYIKAATLIASKLTINNSRFASLGSYMKEKYFSLALLCHLLVSPASARNYLNELIQAYKISTDYKIDIIKSIINNYEVFKFGTCIKQIINLIINDKISESIVECIKRTREKYNKNKTLGDKLILGCIKNTDSSGSYKNKINNHKNQLLKNVKLPNTRSTTYQSTCGDNLLKSFSNDPDIPDLR
jgi:tetratricopeptide (TPR) repeat protein